jgi:hypothetical protein
MSLLSQFFPSGRISAAQKIEVLLVGGGGGGGASGGTCINIPCCPTVVGGIVGGGGGGGQVVFSDGYEVIQDVSYPITVGAGGAGGGFYYDTTNVYYPRQSITPTCPIGCYCPQIHNRNAGTLRGANGGNTIFGSVVSYGGGGGGGGMSNVVNYLPEICNGAAIAACSQWTAKGADGGTGGGSGSGYCGTGCLVVETVSPSSDVRPGRAIYNSSISFLKFGTDGTKFKVPSCFSNISPVQSDANAFSVLTYATGGGGNNTSNTGPVAGSPICLVTPDVSLTCMTSAPAPNALACFTNSDATSTCPGGKGFYSFCVGPNCSRATAAVNAFMEGSIGDSSNNNQYNSCNDFLGSLRGGDGYETTVTPSPEYYGGGGGVVYGMSGCFACTVLAGAVISPGSPCYPDPSWVNSSPRAWMTCPYGGKGGGGSVCTPLITCIPSVRCFCQILNCSIPGTALFPGIRGVGVCGPLCVTQLPVPGTICPGAGQTNCGGGGSSFHGGCQFTSTGDVFPNATLDPGGADTCAFCGFAGGSGTVIIKYPTAFCAATVTGNTPIAPQSGYNVYKWTSPGSITFPSS